MALTDAEIQEIKERMGYGGVTALANPYLDTAPAFETVVQNNVNDYAESQIRTSYLPKLRQLETDRYKSRTRLKASKVDGGDLVLNPRERLELGEEYMYWLKRLSSAIRIPIARPPGGGGGSSVELR